MIENDESFKRILAIDFGLKRIGLALSDPLFTFAYPYKTILNDANTFNELKKIIKDQGVIKIILGFPKKENGEPASITGEVLKFKQKLEAEFFIQVLLRDERYTSYIASEIIAKSVAKKSKRREKGLVDRGSAAIMLQDFLDINKKKIFP